MTDQTRWGIPEIQIKTKIKKQTDDNFNNGIKCTKRLTKVHIINLEPKRDQLLKEKKQND